MSGLEEYNEKRDFEKTPEPDSSTRISEESNRFVIQHHLARRDHYDFRLEVNGTLVSWAIPKEPVADPSVKRLAIKVEDHPVSYIHFEGNIPKGNYGAGSVMVWELGYYYLEDRSYPDNTEMERMINKGHVKFYLNGSKLRGVFHLVKIKDSKKDEWLFMKGAEPEEETNAHERSALTGRSMEEIVKEGAKVKKRSMKETPQEKSPEAFASKTDFPGFIPPMLATVRDEPFDNLEWIFELKLDGYRVLGTKNDEQLDLYSRNGNLFNDKYPAIAKALNTLNADFVMDGEVCYMEDDKPNFQKLQHDFSNDKAVHYYAFDLLWLNGHNLKEVPLILRKSLLKELLKKPPKNIHYLDHVEKEGTKLFDEIKTKNQEGIIAKRKESIYYSDLRSKDWQKIKTSLRQEMLICGFIPSEKTGMKFSSLLLAVNKNEELVYTGKVGTGFSDAMQNELFEKMMALVTAKPAVINPPKHKDITWIKPELICEVRFTEWTTSGVMRHPAFMGLREDKAADKIVLETPIEIIDNPTKVKLSNPEKIFFPEEKLTKKDVFDYYQKVAPIILPYLINRPQSLYRTPDGIKSSGFFQKDMKDQAPDWAETIKIKHGDEDPINYLLCQDLDTLLYMVNLGCVEINPWNSSVEHLDNPDFMIFDLDPVDVDLADLVNVSLEFRKTFEELGLPSFVKTSGSRGIHIYIPVEPKYTFTQIQSVVKTLETHVHQKTKSITSFERSPSKRQGKIYLDYLQNGRGKTMASVYSLRPRKGATISTPLDWDEVTPQLNPADFNLHTIHDRIKQKGDLWKDIFEQQVDLDSIIKRK